MIFLILALYDFQDFQLKVEQAVQACQEFSKLYYETVDKKRHVSCYIMLHEHKLRAHMHACRDREREHLKILKTCCIARETCM